MTLASITLSGTISKDAEQRFTPNNNSVVSFTMKILRYDGRAKEEKTYPVRVNVWGDNFAQIVDRLKVGAKVIVNGRLQIDQFNDQSGKQVRLAVVEANQLNFAQDLVGSATTAMNQQEQAVPMDAPSFDQLDAAAASAPSNTEEIPF